MRSFETHAVFNQSPPLVGVNLFTADRLLREAIAREGVASDDATLVAFGARAGSAEAADWARLANEFGPVLRTHDTRGNRIDFIEFNPAYHSLMAASFAAGANRLGEGPAPNVKRAAKLFLAAQMEPGHCCPITMTNAAQPVLERAGDVGRMWLQKARAENYDARFIPAGEKTSVTIGMGMTEKQGGSDVRANTTRAEPLSRSGAGQTYAITGHKWFMSAPMCDAFLVLAQTPKGLTCFLMPRFRSDGTLNALRFQRLKSKLGNRSNASSEVEFEGAEAYAIGEEGEGTRVIIEMVTATRLDCVVSSAALMRQALAHAIHHAGYRTAFQRKLIDQPLMQQVLADLALDVEASMTLAFRLAHAFDHAESPIENAWRRLMTPVIKYWVCKIAPPFAAEAMECLGGNGYVEDWPLARIYREVPVNSIWEGSGNIMVLDILRAWQRERDAAMTLLEDFRVSAADDRVVCDRVERIAPLIREREPDPAMGREIAEGLALIAAANLLRRHAPAAISEGFVANRVGNERQRTYGRPVADARQIIERAALAL